MGRLKPRSKKRRDEADRRAGIVARALAEARYTCRARDLVQQVPCGGPLDVDEIMGRGVNPGGHLDPGNVQVLCRRHHEWKHNHPAEARRLGLTKRYGDA